MRQAILAFLWLCVFSALTSVKAYADADSQAQKTGGDSVADTVARIREALKKQGFEISLVVDHAAAAASVGLELPHTQLVLARPPLADARALLARSATLGIDLPLKFLVFEDDGEVRVKANPVGYLVDRHNPRIDDRLLAALNTSIEKIAPSASGLVTVQSKQDLDSTVESLKKAISSKPGFRIPLVLDYHQLDDRKHQQRDRPRRPVLILFGNPKVGTPLMQVDRRIAIDLPQKFLVWEDKNGAVNISYNDPFFIADRHSVLGEDKRLEAISKALRALALAGAGEN